jgi:hypothetical protein
MLIQEISPDESLLFLKHLHLGRLGCEQDSQPYVVPFDFACDGSYLYSFSTVGQTINWARANPLVCVQTDEVKSPQEWVSFVILGRYEELPDSPEWKAPRDLAFKLLQERAMWWEPGYAKTVIQGVERPLVPVYFRIQIVEITGRRATSES